MGSFGDVGGGARGLLGLGVAERPAGEGEEHVVERGAVHLDGLERDAGALDLVDYRLNDGAEVPGSHRQLLDMGAGAFVLSGSVMWLDATTMAFVLGQGISSPDWSIGTIRTK